jgi:putative endonuclease
MKTYRVYILKCNDWSYYTWVTNNLEKRIREHNNSNNIQSYTYNKRPIIPVYHEETSDIKAAIQREKQIKWRSRKKKEMLIQWRFDELTTYWKE